MDNIDYIYASNGSGEAPRMTVTAARAPGAATLTVDSVANVPNKFVATVGTLDPSTDLIDPATAIVFKGSIVSGAVNIDALAPGYTDPTGNAVGQVVVIKPATEWADLVAAALHDMKTKFGTIIDPTTGDLTPAGSTQAGEARKTPRISVAASTATLTPNVDSFNYYRLTAQAVALTIAAPTGTPLEGEGLLIEIADNGTSRALTWNAAYETDSIYGLTLPTATVASKIHFLTFVWNSGKAKWVWIA